MPALRKWSAATAHLFAQRNRRLIRAVRRGMPVAGAAQAFGLSLRRAYHICYGEGLTFGAGAAAGARAAQARLDRKIAGAARQGRTCRELSTRFGVSKGRVRRTCAAQGVSPAAGVLPSRQRMLRERRALRSRAARSPASLRALLAGCHVSPSRANATILALLLNTERTLASIAAECGVSREWVHRLWRGVRGSHRSNEG